MSPATASVISHIEQVPSGFRAQGSEGVAPDSDFFILNLRLIPNYTPDRIRPAQMPTHQARKSYAYRWNSYTCSFQRFLFLVLVNDADFRCLLALNRAERDMAS